MPDVLLESGLHRAQPCMCDALADPDFGAESTLDSLDSIIQYSLQHLDRLHRPCNCQPLYMED